MDNLQTHPEGDRLLVGILVRVSTKRQGERGASTETQRSDCLAYAEREGWTVAVIEEDHDTGTNFDRAGYQRLLSAAKEGRIHGIVDTLVTRASPLTAAEEETYLLYATRNAVTRHAKPPPTLQGLEHQEVEETTASVALSNAAPADLYAYSPLMRQVLRCAATREFHVEDRFGNVRRKMPAYLQEAILSQGGVLLLPRAAL